MKFTWFHLMPWPHLPADYRGPAWITCPNELYDPALGHQLYNRYLDELELAEQLGFDGLVVNEHHQNAYGLMPSPNLFAAMLARRTTTAKIAVVANPALYNPPTRVAESSPSYVVTVGVLSPAWSSAAAPLLQLRTPGPEPPRFADPRSPHPGRTSRPFEFAASSTSRYVNPAEAAAATHPRLGAGHRVLSRLLSSLQRGLRTRLPFFHMSIFEKNYASSRTCSSRAPDPSNPAAAADLRAETAEQLVRSIRLLILRPRLSTLCNSPPVHDSPLAMSHARGGRPVHALGQAVEDFIDGGERRGSPATVTER